MNTPFTDKKLKLLHELEKLCYIETIEDWAIIAQSINEAYEAGKEAAIYQDDEVETRIFKAIRIAEAETAREILKEVRMLDWCSVCKLTLEDIEALISSKFLKEDSTKGVSHSEVKRQLFEKRPDIKAAYDAEDSPSSNS